MFIVGIGGTLRSNTTTEGAVRTALRAAQDRGADILMLGAAALDLPLYDPTAHALHPKAATLLESIRSADGIILGSPGYHGTVSGLVKNALDYVEATAADEPPYLTDLPVGCIAVAHGWQAAVGTLRTLRDIAHTLRGWPTPYGAAINAAGSVFHEGRCVDETVSEQLALVGQQVIDFCKMREAALMTAAPRGA